jgi:alpha-tubulin suppressor-like RCC1 family protein
MPLASDELLNENDDDDENDNDDDNDENENDNDDASVDALLSKSSSSSISNMDCVAAMYCCIVQRSIAVFHECFNMVDATLGDVVVVFDR